MTCPLCPVLLAATDYDSGTRDSGTTSGESSSSSKNYEIIYIYLIIYIFIINYK